MIRSIMTLLLLSVVLSSTRAQPLSSSEPAAIVPTANSAELIANPEDWDGKEILFQGEAIGPLLRRGGHVWVNVLDANAALGIFMSSDTARPIGKVGSYERKGDTLRARGVFHRACPDHGGDMDIHASTVAIIEDGKSTKHPVDPFQLALAPVFLALAAILFILWRKRNTATP